jgi:hypothetical protein
MAVRAGPVERQGLKSMSIGTRAVRNVELAVSPNGTRGSASVRRSEKALRPIDYRGR